MLTDYDRVVPLLRRELPETASIVAFALPGTAWSPDAPSLASLWELCAVNGYADGVCNALPSVAQRLGVADSADWALLGRGLGAAPAVHLAFSRPTLFALLVLEGAAIDLQALPAVRRAAHTFDGGTKLRRRCADPCATHAKLAGVRCPVLILQGEDDAHSPAEMARAAEIACRGGSAGSVDLEMYADAGHADLLRGERCAECARDIAVALRRATSKNVPAVDASELRALGVGELKKRISAAGGNPGACLTKDDLVETLRASLSLTRMP